MINHHKSLKTHPFLLLFEQILSSTYLWFNSQTKKSKPNLPHFVFSVIN